MAFLSVFSLSILGAEKCSTELRGNVYTKSGSQAIDQAVDRKTTKEVSSWEECYKVALKKAKKDPHIGSGSLSRFGFHVDNFGIRLYVRWVFDDGYFNDSNGKVTRYSSNKPKKADQRVDENGDFYNTSTGNCDFEIRGMIFTVNGRIAIDQALGRKVSRNLSDWEACYSHAISVAKKHPHITSGSIRLYVKWVFDDGYFNDSDGKVTKYSSTDDTSRGDRRVDEDGDFY